MSHAECTQDQPVPGLVPVDFGNPTAGRPSVSAAPFRVGARPDAGRRSPAGPHAGLALGNRFRHTGQTLAAATGATIKDLMKRLGHASTVAAFRYLHAVDGRDAEIAMALSKIAAHGSSAKLPRTII